MGTQQILLIVLSVFIVGAAIAVGIQMFNNQSYSANKTAIAADAQSYASQIVQYYKTPESQGGLGGDFMIGTTDVADSDVGGFIGWGGDTLDDSENGTYFIDTSDTANDHIIIYGLGNEQKGTGASGTKPAVQTTITFPEGSITASVMDVPANTEETLAGIDGAFNPGD
jgi:hypothetical protein